MRVPSFDPRCKPSHKSHKSLRQLTRGPAVFSRPPTTFNRATRAVARSPVPGHFTLSSRFLFSFSYCRAWYSIVSYPSSSPEPIPPFHRPQIVPRRVCVTHTHTLSLSLPSPPPLLRPRFPFWDRDPPWITQPELALQPYFPQQFKCPTDSS